MIGNEADEASKKIILICVSLCCICVMMYNVQTPRLKEFCLYTEGGKN